MPHTDPTKVPFRTHGTFQVGTLQPSNCTHVKVASRLRSIISRSKGLLTLEEAGRSLEDRSIVLVRCGSGARRVLLWSQMHGDESTATLALMDIFNFIAREGIGNRLVGRLVENLSIFCIPMLNPDGAQRRQRHTASGIDMNRDARRFSTPEARILRRVHRFVKPHFAFNLHDQELSTVGNTPSVAAIALLAPAADGRGNMTSARTRAMRVASLMAQSLQDFAPGHISRYDDAYEPRAFGDRMQSWGTGTILVESGHWPGDPKKQFIRRLNYVGLLSALDGIATGRYQKTRLRQYSKLPQNGKRAYHVIIRGVQLRGGGWGETVDIGFNIEGVKQSLARIKEIGDLKGFASLKEVDGRTIRLQSNILKAEQLVSLKRMKRLLHARF